MHLVQIHYERGQIMTRYREILRLKSLGLSERTIASSVPCSRNTVSKVLKRAAEMGISWPLPGDATDATLEKQLFPSAESSKPRQMPDYSYIRKELMRHGVSKKLLWAEYMETCRQQGALPLMYSQFCYYIQQDEQKHRATMHIQRKPGEQMEVDWAGDPAHIVDPDTGAFLDLYVFVGVLTYSQYAYVEAFPDMKQTSWIAAHIHMFEYFGGAAKILVPDNTRTAVLRNNGRDDPELNTVYQEMAEHYGTAIIPARVWAPKDKPNAEGTVGNISTWIIAALRKETFFTIAEINLAIREKLKIFNNRPFQKKAGSRYSLFIEERPFLLPLPVNRYELAEWKIATVQFNYHVSADGMMYSVPHTYIGQKVNVRMTETIIEIFFRQDRIASHKRLHGRKGQYSTITDHMPKDHQAYLTWNGDRFRQWAETIGPDTKHIVDAMLRSSRVEQQAYRACMGLLKLADRYSKERLEDACKTALSYTGTPSLKSVKNILAVTNERNIPAQETKAESHHHGITRGSDYYGRDRK